MRYFVFDMVDVIFVHLVDIWDLEPGCQRLLLIEVHKLLGRYPSHAVLIDKIPYSGKNLGLFKRAKCVLFLVECFEFFMLFFLFVVRIIIKMKMYRLHN